MIPDKDTIRDLAKTEPVHPLVVGNDVYDPLIFQPTLVRFTRKQYLFLNHYRMGVPLAEAAAKAEMTSESADRFLAKPDTIAWLQDRALKDHIRDEWQEPSKWWHLGAEVLEGKKHLSKDQQIVYMAFGDRICPKAKESVGGTPKIVINIDPGAVQEAFRRQNALEAEIVQEKSA